METWTIDEEARRLAERFAGMNRAKFARTFGVPGGQVMIYQHITGRRPISLEAAEVYARGFGCSLEEISPRLAEEAAKAAAILGKESEAEREQSQALTEDEAQLIDSYRAAASETKPTILAIVKGLADQNSEKVNSVTASNDGTINVTGRRQTVLEEGVSNLDEAESDAGSKLEEESASGNSKERGRKDN